LIISVKNIVKDNYTPSGYAAAKEDLAPKEEVSNCQKELEKPLKKVAASTSTVPSKAPVASPSPPVAKKDEISSSFDTYHEFTVKYSEIVEEFMKMESLEASKEYLLKYGDILLQENASNYLLLASLEDEMNGYREKMKLTCRQSQMISNIAELAKSMHTHPGNVIIPFFKRMEQKELLEGFMLGVDEFAKKIIARAVTKREEMDRERKEHEIARAHEEGTDLESIPKEERLGPGGLDPLEVIETLPAVMQEAFESRDVEKLKEALLSMDPGEAQYHMKRCVDSGLWCDNS
jgi:cell division cycle protein 37